MLGFCRGNRIDLLVNLWMLLPTSVSSDESAQRTPKSSPETAPCSHAEALPLTPRVRTAHCRRALRCAHGAHSGLPDRAIRPAGGPLR